MNPIINNLKMRIRFLPLLITVYIVILAISCKKEDNPVDITEYNLNINPQSQFQTFEGFGASLAFYEGWLTAHPNKKEIYNAIFKELSLDILRIRNTYDYDAGMIDRVSEFAREAEASLGKPIKILSTSWGPPAYLKSNHDRTNGGTIKYSISNSQVLFDYSGFANWWEEALNEYNSHGVYPTYIGIQNEPDFTASYESCRFNPVEKITSADTIAGYNKAIEAVYNMINGRAIKPKLLGPESVGVGYNNVENYINALNTSYLYGIAHHLYHGVNKDDPWSSTDIAKVGAFRPEIPHFQTEYSLGDWFSLAGLIYKSLSDENAVAYLYWQLIWDGGGLVSLDFPWDQNRWSNSKGYTKTRDFYVFKQFSAFIHPGWKRISTSPDNYYIKTLAFTNPAKDSAAIVLINRSATEQYRTNIAVSGITFKKTSFYRTSDIDDCALINNSKNSEIILPPHSITTVAMSLLK
jgi:glucuronoarabinoxylan endo-1,4-beta-xylanase